MTDSDGWQWGTHAAGSVNVIERDSEVIARAAIQVSPGPLHLYRRRPAGAWEAAPATPSRGEAPPAATDAAGAVRTALSAIRTDMEHCPMDEILDRIEADLPGMVAERIGASHG